MRDGKTNTACFRFARRGNTGIRPRGSGRFIPDVSRAHVHQALRLNSPAETGSYHTRRASGTASDTVKIVFKKFCGDSWPNMVRWQVATKLAVGWLGVDPISGKHRQVAAKGATGTHGAVATGMHPRGA
jgi:hypothetical protein